MNSSVNACAAEESPPLKRSDVSICSLSRTSVSYSCPATVFMSPKRKNTGNSTAWSLFIISTIFFLSGGTAATSR